MKPCCRLALLVFTLAGSAALAAGTFRIASYNVENYLDQPTESRSHAKSAEARAKIRESIRAAKPDVLALQEMGTTNALLELRASLRAEGLDFPFWEHVEAVDTNVHLAVLSKFPIVARHPHTREEFLLDGRRFRMERGLAEVDIRAATNFYFTLIVAHLKSRRPVPNADEAQERLAEAKVLRGIVDAHFKADPNARLVVLGDFNDVQNSDAVKEIIGRGRFKLTDTRPAERNGDRAPAGTASFDPRDVTRTEDDGKSGNADLPANPVAWTYHFGQEDVYARVDYLLLSPAMARDWVKSETGIPVVPGWGIGSDHRPIVAAFKIN